VASGEDHAKSREEQVYEMRFTILFTKIPKEGFIHGRGIGVIRYGILFLRGKL
jgi:hypothetical protein